MMPPSVKCGPIGLALAIALCLIAAVRAADQACKRQNYTNYYAGDISRTIGEYENPDQCCKACREDPECSAWQYTPISYNPDRMNICYLKRAVVNPFATTGNIVSGIVPGRGGRCSAPPSTNAGSCIAFRQARWDPQNLTVEMFKGLQKLGSDLRPECCQRCSYDEKCIFYDTMELHNGTTSCDRYGFTLDGSAQNALPTVDTKARKASKAVHDKYGRKFSYIYTRKWQSVAFLEPESLPDLPPFWAFDPSECQRRCQLQCGCFFWTFNLTGSSCALLGKGTSNITQDYGAYQTFSGMHIGPKLQFELVKLDVESTSPEIQIDDRAWPDDTRTTVKGVWHMQETLFRGYNISSLDIDMANITNTGNASWPFQTLRLTQLPSHEAVLPFEVEVPLDDAVGGAYLAGEDVLKVADITLTLRLTFRVGFCGGFEGVDRNPELWFKRTFMGFGHTCFGDSDEERSEVTVLAELALAGLPMAAGRGGMGDDAEPDEDLEFDDLEVEMRPHPTYYSENAGTGDEVRCNPEPDRSLTGNPTSELCVTTWQDCCNACKDEDCGGWSFSYANQSCGAGARCALFYRHLRGPVEFGTISGIGKVVTPDGKKQCGLWPGIRVSGDYLEPPNQQADVMDFAPVPKLTGTVVANEAECCELCWQTKDCRAWQLILEQFPSWKQCFLLKSVQTTDRKPGPWPTDWVNSGYLIGPGAAKTCHSNPVICRGPPSSLAKTLYGYQWELPPANNTNSSLADEATMGRGASIAKDGDLWFADVNACCTSCEQDEYCMFFAYTAFPLGCLLFSASSGKVPDLVPALHGDATYASFHYHKQFNDRAFLLNSTAAKDENLLVNSFQNLTDAFQCAVRCRVGSNRETNCTHWTFLDSATLHDDSPKELLARLDDIKGLQLNGTKAETLCLLMMGHLGAVEAHDWQGSIAGVEMGPVMNLTYLEPQPLLGTEEVEESLNETTIKHVCRFRNLGSEEMEVTSCEYTVNVTLELNETLYTGYELELLQINISERIVPTLAEQLDLTGGSIKFEQVMVEAERPVHSNVTVELQFDVPFVVPPHGSIEVEMPLDVVTVKVPYLLRFEGSSKNKFHYLAAYTAYEFQSLLGYGQFCGRFETDTLAHVEYEPSWKLGVTGELLMHQVPVELEVKPRLVAKQSDETCNPNLGKVLAGIPLTKPECVSRWEDCCSRCNDEEECLAWNFVKSGSDAWSGVDWYEEQPRCKSNQGACKLHGFARHGNDADGAVSGTVTLRQPLPQELRSGRLLRQSLSGEIQTYPEELLCNAKSTYFEEGEALDKKDQRSWKACCQMCQHSAECAGWSFGKEDPEGGLEPGQCMLYKGPLAKASNASGVVSGDLSNKENYEGCHALPDIELGYEKDDLIEGGLVDTLFNEHQCCATCEEEGACLAYSYSYFTGECVLLKAVRGAKQRPGAAAGINSKSQDDCQPTIVYAMPGLSVANVMASADPGISWADVCCFNDLGDCAEEQDAGKHSGRSLLVPRECTLKQNKTEAFNKCIKDYEDKVPKVKLFTGIQLLPGVSGLNRRRVLLEEGPRIQTEDADGCWRVCYAEGCKAFSWDSRDSKCQLLEDELGGARASDSYTSGVSAADSCPSAVPMKAGEELKTQDGVHWQKICCFNGGSVVGKNNACVVEKNVNITVPCASNKLTDKCFDTAEAGPESESDGISTVALVLAIVFSILGGVLVGIAGFAIHRYIQTKNAKKYNRLYDIIGGGDSKSSGVGANLLRKRTGGGETRKVGGTKYEWDTQELHKSENSAVVAGRNLMAGNKRVAGKFFVNEADYIRERDFYRDMQRTVGSQYIPEVYDFVEHKGDNDCVYCIIMEAGDYTLADFLGRRRGGGQDMVKLKSILHNVAQGLAQLHASRIVWGDLKPQNVMWFNADHRWKLLDFATWQLQGMTGVPNYTLRYSAPEVVGAALDNCAVPSHPSSDAWAFGVIAWECFVGEPLFGPSYSDEEVTSMLRGMSPLPFERHQQLWLAIQEEQARHLVRNLLKREPTERYTLKKVLDNATFRAADNTVMQSNRWEGLWGRLQELKSKMEVMQEVSGEMLMQAATPALAVCMQWQQLMPGQLPSDADTGTLSQHLLPEEGSMKPAGNNNSGDKGLGSHAAPLLSSGRSESMKSTFHDAQDDLAPDSYSDDRSIDGSFRSRSFTKKGSYKRGSFRLRGSGSREGEHGEGIEMLIPSVPAPGDVRDRVPSRGASGKLSINGSDAGGDIFQGDDGHDGFYDGEDFFEDTMEGLCKELQEDDTLYELYSKYAKGIVAVEEAPYNLMASVGPALGLGPADVIVQLRACSRYAIRIKVLCGSGVELPLPVKDLHYLAVQRQARDSQEPLGKPQVLQVEQLPETTDYEWHGFAIWDTTDLPLGQSDLSIAMFFKLVVDDRTTQLQKRVAVQVHEESASLAPYQAAATASRLWEDAPEWVKLGAAGVTYFFEKKK